ncbi:MAG: hypothetical protein HZA61_02005 [Candidatus Eisenbacteria bacterium]|uniref:Uncharacterized protein n=1 Tax=Eiseniibacteriota bacterium TaxID=2212470 RepID=A0A933SAR5_UNCEI|nr:hypothetical protein [Candidatus Eisenbacteria bacterium]
MSDRASSARRESPWRLARECAFGLCTAWLIVQNAVLLAVLVRWQPNALALAFESLQKALVLMLPLWLIPVAALAGLAIATTLTRGAVVRGAERWEMEHGRTR